MNDMNCKPNNSFNDEFDLKAFALIMLIAFSVMSKYGGRYIFQKNKESFDK